MPYRFNEYVSTYVDPQSLKISETLQQRYKENLAANDQLAMALDQMKAALPFEQDVEKKKALQTDIDNTLSMLADRGDYENLGFAVHKTAKEFSKKYAPIKENYERYNAALTDLQEAVKKGDVNQEYAKLFPLYMVKDYKGFELDPETGRVKEGTMFSAPSYIKDPKIMEKLKDALQILKPEKFSSEIESLSGGDGKFWVTTKNGVEEIKMEDVQDVIDAVFAEPDVKAYVEQFADMKTYAATKDKGAVQTVTDMSANYVNAIKEITTLLEDRNLNSKQKSAYKAQLEVLGKEINKISEASKEEGSSYEYVKNMYKKDILEPYQTYGEKAAIRSEEHSVKKRFSEQYLKDREWQLANQTLEVQGQVTLADRYGATYAEKDQMAKDLYAKAWQQQQYLDQQGSSLSEYDRKVLQDGIKSQIDQANLIRQQMMTAANSAITERDLKSKDEKLYNTMKSLYPYASPGEIYVRIQEAFDNAGDQDYKDLEKKFQEINGSSLGSHVSGKYSTEAFPSMGYGAPGAGGMGVGAFASKEVRDKMYSGYGGGDGTNDKLIQSFNNSFKNRVDQQFSEIKTSSTFSYGAIPAPSVEESIKITEAMKNFFIGKPITADFQVSDLTNEGLKTVYGRDLSGFKVVDVGWNSNENIYELKLLGGTNDAPISKTVHLDGQYIRNTTLDKVLNAPETGLANTVSKMDLRKKGEVSSRKVKIGGRDAYMLVESDGAGNPYIRFVDENFQNFTERNSKNISVFSQKHSLNSPELREIITQVDGANPELLPLVKF